MARYTIDFGDEFDQKLTELAKVKETSKADIIRRAVITYDYLGRQVDDKKGTTISVTRDTEQGPQILKDIILP